jgi:hypothetical protein
MITRPNPSRMMLPLGEGRDFAWRYGAFPATTLIIPEPMLLEARRTLEGRFDFPKHPREPDPRSIIDMGAGCGAFMAWATLRWPYAWIDAVELNTELAKRCIMNAPPGARVYAHDILEEVTKVPDDAPEYLTDMRASFDVLHCSADFDVQSLRIDFAALKIACVETPDSKSFVRVARFFDELGFTLAAADAGAQTWIRLQDADGVDANFGKLEALEALEKGTRS